MAISSAGEVPRAEEKRFQPGLSRYVSTGAVLSAASPAGLTMRAVLYGAIEATEEMNNVRIGEIARNASDYSRELIRDVRKFEQLVRPQEFGVELFVLSTRTGQPYRYTVMFRQTAEWKMSVTSSISPLTLTVTGPYEIPMEKTWYTDQAVQPPVRNDAAIQLAAACAVLILLIISWFVDYIREFLACERWRERYKLTQLPSGGMVWVAQLEKVAEVATVPTETDGMKKKKKKMKMLTFSPFDVARKIIALFRHALSFHPSRSYWPLWGFVSSFVSMGFAGLLAYELYLGMTAKAYIQGWFPSLQPSERELCAQSADEIYADECDPDFSHVALDKWPQTLADLYARDQHTLIVRTVASAHVALLGVRLLRFLGFHQGLALLG